MKISQLKAENWEIRWWWWLW